MNKINIRGIKNIDDPFYRYQMPVVCVEKRKTRNVFINPLPICDSIGRDINILIKYLKIKFSCSLIYDSKNKCITCNKLTDKDIQDAIYEFIEYYVLCPTCQNPETILYNQNNKIKIKCKACSHDELLLNKKVS